MLFEGDPSPGLPQPEPTERKCEVKTTITIKDSQAVSKWLEYKFLAKLAREMDSKDKIVDFILSPRLSSNQPFG